MWSVAFGSLAIFFVIGILVIGYWYIGYWLLVISGLVEASKLAVFYGAYGKY
jgi:hypothetical protein